MSLFPAYLGQSDHNKAKSPENVNNETVWLSNSSFNIDLPPTIAFSQAETPSAPQQKDLEELFSSDTSEEQPRVKHRKKHSKKCKPEPEKEPINNEHFDIDRKGSKEFLMVRTISRPAVSRYRVCLYLTSSRKSRNKKFKRYFQVLLNGDKDNKSNSDEETLTKKQLDEKVPKEMNENFAGFKQEEDLTQTTAFYNRVLAENSHDIDMWLKYVLFQDTVFQFEKSFRKGSIAKGLRVTAERKLSILDKALSHNPNCEKLLRERLNVAVSVYPSDELYLHLEKLVKKEQSNIILWQGFIESRQCSMSHCTTPKVLDLYTKCLSILHKLRRSAKLEKSILEENILRMLYQCGLFMKQAGLFEQLWTLLHLYLELNLSQSKFNTDMALQENQLLELEELVLNSQLPLHELWLRIEKLRESCHWLPYTGEDTCEDPQRLVFSEDVAELIHPIAMPGNTFKLTATILTLLKVPLLPCRHTTMKKLGIDYVPWALDSVETLLPVFLPIYPIDISNKHLLKYTQKLAVGPQYLKTLPCQEEYLEFLLRIMKNCADSLRDTNKIAVMVWWFRFLRLLVILDKGEDFKMSVPLKKRMKTSIKNVLKQEDSRTNVIYFQEYAAIECEQGNIESGKNVLVTAITVTFNNKSVLDLKNESEQANLCFLYRSLVEIYLNNPTEDGNQKCLRYLICFILGKDVQNTSSFITQGSISEASLKFKHVYLLLLQRDLETIDIDAHFLPNFLTDFLICYGWFVYLTKGAIDCGKFLEETLAAIDEKCNENRWQKEVLFEFYVAVLFKNCMDKLGMFRLLDDVLHRAIEKYPNNLFLLSVLSKKQSLNCTLGPPWWKVQSLLLKTGHALPILFVILIANQKMAQIEENLVDTITGESVSLDSSIKNRMLSIFKRITRPDMCTRRCGLVWRLYLQFLHDHFDPKMCRNAYYQAVEECPWLKSLYIDAAVYIPAELSQIQDLIIEKQLRIHVTPEELDILRN